MPGTTLRNSSGDVVYAPPVGQGLLRDLLANWETFVHNIMRHKNNYYSLLLDVTRNEVWESWILYMLDAVEATARWTLEKISAIRIQFEQTRVELRTPNGCAISQTALRDRHP